MTHVAINTYYSCFYPNKYVKSPHACILGTSTYPATLAPSSNVLNKRDASQMILGENAKARTL